ncbi:MAG: TIGR00159 family protein [Blautia sp.]|nr:TIGR00159 family protein [Blautia sp.]
MQELVTGISKYFSRLSLPRLGLIDVIEILIISFVIYQFIIWIKFSRAYTLLKGILVVLLFVLVAYVFKMNTILWIIQNLASVLAIGIIVIFQPELRRVLEELGQKNIMSSIFSFEAGKEIQERFTDRTINEMVKACFEMGDVKTGALIVVEQDVRLTDYERTGINIDAILSSQLLINIFEHNTPLHDGAVIVRGNRVVSATCYLPLSDSTQLSKQLGTRHRAGVGISEVSDSLTIIVSEETGKVSIAKEGRLIRNISAAELKAQLVKLQNKKIIDNSKIRGWLKGRVRNEAKSDK